MSLLVSLRIRLGTVLSSLALHPLLLQSSFSRSRSRAAARELLLLRELLLIRLTIVKIIKTISVLSVKFLGVPWNTSCGNALRTGFITPFLSTRFNFGSDGASVALPIIIMRLFLTWLPPFKTSGIFDIPMEDLIFLPNFSCGIVLSILGHAPCPFI